MYYALPTFLVTVPVLFALPGVEQEKPPPVEALYGEWEVVEMVYRGKLEVFGGGTNGGWFVFEPGTFLRLFSAQDRDKVAREKWLKKALTRRCTIRPYEIDIWEKTHRQEEKLSKARYDLKNGRLRIIWHESYGERPTNFDAIGNPELTLFVLQKVK